MTYSAIDDSVDRGAPFELYEFTVPGSGVFWKFCDSLEPYAGYTTAAITRSNIVRDAEQIGSGLSITVAHDNPLALELFAGLSNRPVRVLIKAGHLGDASAQVVPIYRGLVAGVHFNGAQAEITCVSRFAISTQRKIPWITTQAGCNWELGGEGCGIDLTSFTTEAVVLPGDQSGNTLTVGAASLKPDGYFNGGHVLRPLTDGSLRFIRSHVGDQLVLDRPFSGMSDSGDVYHFRPGCKKTEDDCATRFNNLPNYLGWSRLPSINPFNRSAFYLSSTPSAPASTWELPPPYSGYSLVTKQISVSGERWKNLGAFDFNFAISGELRCKASGENNIPRIDSTAFTDPLPLPIGASSLFDLYIEGASILEGSANVSTLRVQVYGGDLPAETNSDPSMVDFNINTWVHFTSAVYGRVRFFKEADYAHFKIKLPYRIRERSSGFWRSQGFIIFESKE